VKQCRQGPTLRPPKLEVEEAEFEPHVRDVNVKSIFLFAHCGRSDDCEGEIGRDHQDRLAAGIRPRHRTATWYNASKGAVNILSKSMAGRWPPDGIRVCAIARGPGEDAAAPELHGPAIRRSWRAQLQGSVPLGRFAPVAGTWPMRPCFLASDRGLFLTGNVLAVGRRALRVGGDEELRIPGGLLRPQARGKSRMIAIPVVGALALPPSLGVLRLGQGTTNNVGT